MRRLALIVLTCFSCVAGSTVISDEEIYQILTQERDARQTAIALTILADRHARRGDVARAYRLYQKARALLDPRDENVPSISAKLAGLQGNLQLKEETEEHVRHSPPLIVKQRAR